jgi:hypothetical protein
MTATTATAADIPSRSPFAGNDVCEQAGLSLPTATRRPLFDQDLWDFTHVVGLPVEMPLADRRFDFTPITDPRWRLVAKELVFALLAPRHPTVAPLPRAYRTPLHLRSCSARLEEAARLFAWLTARGATSLMELDTHSCEAYLAFRRYITDDDGTVVGEHGPKRPSRRRADHRRPGRLPRLVHRRPGPSRSASLGRGHGVGRRRNALRQSDEQNPAGRGRGVAADVRCGVAPGGTSRSAHHRAQRADPPDRPLLLPQRSRTTGRRTKRDRRHRRRAGRHMATNTPLPRIEDHSADRRLAAGWSVEDPWFPVATSVLARQAGYAEFQPRWLPRLRPLLTDAVAAVGIEKMFARNASDAPTADSKRRTAMEPAAPQIRGCRSGWDRAHRSDHRPGHLLGNAGQRETGGIAFDATFGHGG